MMDQNNDYDYDYGDGNDDDDDSMVRAAMEASLASHQIELTQALQGAQVATTAAIVPMEQEQQQQHMTMIKTMAEQQQEKEDEELAMAMNESGQEQLHRVINSELIEWKVSSTRDCLVGSWDCVHCTYTNRPYQRSCEVCGRQAPLHVLTYVDIPSVVRFGLEIEVIIPRGKYDGLTLRTIADNLSRLFQQTPVRYEGYTHRTNDYWKVVTDSSIHAQTDDDDDTDLCLELVSPILRGEDGLSSLRNMMDSVRRLGITTNATCGFHVHIDAEEGRRHGHDNDHDSSSSSPVACLQGLKRIAQCFVSLENAFDVLVSTSWDDDDDDNKTNQTAACHRGRRANKNRYCQSNRLAFGEQSNRQRWQQIAAVRNKSELVSLMNPSGDRYRKLNLTNLTRADRPSTCEFRQHGGVEDLQEAEAWVRLLVLFCHNAARGGPKTDACLLPEGSSPKSELLALFQLVDCDGLEQFFAVEKRLFSDDRVANTEWQCQKCRRTFRSCRSLAQHKDAVGH